MRLHAQFSGLAEVDLGASTSLTLQLSMAGTIPRVFGVERLSIGDVAGSGMCVSVCPRAEESEEMQLTKEGANHWENLFGVTTQTNRRAT